ncbi:hypothetical protein Ciccas_006774 [Cichlidogyrus casuarinus]|uniref:Uncharacterized protein n=1 Tax=Cichlidogyrus casuarinus TaxID=1844966 RepID=A0ABD2Q623_9PLAT
MTILQAESNEFGEEHLAHEEQEGMLVADEDRKRLIEHAEVFSEDVFHEKANRSSGVAKDKEIIKFNVFSKAPALGTISELEIKCGIVTNLDAKKNYEKLFTKEECDSFRNTSFTPDETSISNLVCCSSVETRHLCKVYTNTIRISDEKAFRVVVEEPNPMTILCKRAKEANDEISLAALPVTKVYRDINILDSYFDEVDILGEKKKLANPVPAKQSTTASSPPPTAHRLTCPYRKHGNFTILSKRSYQVVRYDKENDYEIVETKSVIYEPKIIRCLCTDCDKAKIALKSHDDAYDCANFVLNTQVISVYDVLIAISCLIAESTDANDFSRQIALTKYKQRIQRFMNPVN